MNFSAKDYVSWAIAAALATVGVLMYFTTTTFEDSGGELTLTQDSDGWWSSNVAFWLIIAALAAVSLPPLYRRFFGEGKRQHAACAALWEVVSQLPLSRPIRDGAVTYFVAESNASVDRRWLFAVETTDGDRRLRLYEGVRYGWGKRKISPPVMEFSTPYTEADVNQSAIAHSAPKLLIGDSRKLAVPEVTALMLRLESLRDAFKTL